MTRNEFEVYRLNEKGLSKSFDVETIFSDALDALEKVCGKEGRHMALVRTKLEEASFNAQRAIAVDRANQIGRVKKIYVACASAEMDRAKAALAAVRAMGYEVTADWAAHVEKIGVANPSEDALRREAALFDLKGVEAAEVFWLCFPNEKDRGYGTGPELGAAITLRRQRSQDFDGGRANPTIIVSGAHTKRSIFPVLADYEFATDEEALALLKVLL